LHDEGLDVSVSWTGSSIGLAALALGEADISGIHILDQETGSYNIPILDRHWRGQGLVLVRGYLREIGFVTRVELSYEDIVDGILRGDLIVVNRQPGAGARILFETIENKLTDALVETNKWWKERFKLDYVDREIYSEI